MNDYYNMEYIMDNTVNTVMESYRNMLEELNEELELQNIENENPENTDVSFNDDQALQESAILSAISEHGLTASSSSNPDTQTIVQADPLLRQEENSVLEEQLTDYAITSAINSQGLSVLIPHTTPFNANNS